MAEPAAYIYIPKITSNAIRYEEKRLVYCKDCMYYEKKDTSSETGTCKKHENLSPKDKWYCADGVFNRFKDLNPKKKSENT